METVCRLFPDSIQDKCDEYIEAYAEKIIEFVMASMTPDEICAELGLCKPKKIEISEKDSKCVLCEYVMSMLESQLANKTTEAEIREALDKVCTLLPDSIQDKCINFVNTYSDVIVDFLAHQLTPEEVCQQLGLCQIEIDNGEQFNMMLEVEEIVETDQNQPRPYCTLCEYAIGEVDKLITDKKNEEEVKSVLDRICYELSAPIQKECLNMVNKYTDQIIDMFVR